MSFFIANRGERLREERKRLKKDQPAFSELCEVGVQAYLPYEKPDEDEKHRELRADQLAALGNAGVDVWYVLTGKRLLPNEAPRESNQLKDLFEATSDTDGLLKLMRSFVNLYPKN